MSRGLGDVYKRQDITTLIELAQMYQVSLDELFYDDIDLVNKFAEDNKKKER